ncbi:hypothetical protein K7X08_030750 [Anisodus acutangulus]|uniref:Protein kinase domain-containing protein n=1 Tax=Anisodus acutangulus TaxID=402998 RepID=A0A9Q1M009_9SOLA|nr:hypothetical protein K7X08_030750 [Anisodus acutangulus]
MATTLTKFLSFLFHLSLISSSSPNPDTQSLLAFKTSCDESNKLYNWNSSTNPCTTSWVGVSCLSNRVTRVVLEGLDLKGSFHNLTFLKELRVLSLKYNHFSGRVPDLSNLTALKLLFLSHNEFNGELTPLMSLFKLYRLDLSYNKFSGEIPATMNRLTHLLTLRLEENEFSGEISRVYLPNLQEFNISGNKLVGDIPVSLSRFPESAFSNNRVLCGDPLPKCPVVPREPGPNSSSAGAMASPVSPKTTIASSPSSLPVTSATLSPKNNRPDPTRKMSSLAIIAIILGDVFVLGVVCILLYCFFCTRKMSGRKNGSNNILEGEKIVYSSSPYPNTGQTGGGFERGKMVFFEGAKRFELEDLLRASAEMLGKGGFGTAYKAVLDDGNVVAVKRLKELNACGKREFLQQMEVLGRLRHPNLVSLKAYYFARDEKLLVYDFMTNGNLFWLLHGNRGPGRTPLDWTTRLKIAAGAARGLAFIHNSCKSLKLTHGNIKSTNILIDKGGNARVSDFGLAIFATPSSVPKTNGYQAPEVAMDGRKITQKSDVYSFGVLLLELLTGKCPSVEDNGGLGTGSYGGVVDLPRWVQSVVREEWTAEVFDLELMRYKDIEEEMVGLLQIAMACTSTSPDQRPKINYVVKMIEELRGVEVSPSHDTADSVSDSPAVSEDNTCGASQ